MTLAVIMLISRTTCFPSLESLKNLRYDKLYVMLDPRLKETKVVKRLRELKAKIHLQKGIYDPNKYAFGRFELLDGVEEDWIVSLDDDDELLFDYSKVVDGLGSDVGLVFGNDYVRYGESSKTYERRTGEANSPKEVKNVLTGCWCMRTKAWKSISPLVLDRSWWWNDFRIFVYLLKAGWRIKHLDEYVSITRVNSGHYKGKAFPHWREEYRKIMGIILHKVCALCNGKIEEGKQIMFKDEEKMGYLHPKCVKGWQRKRDEK